MRRTFNFLLLFFLSVMTVMAAPGDLQEKLAALKGISGIEKLQSDYYPEKYVVRITQQVDPKDPAAGTFTQRVIVGHVGYDRPTIIVTEGYGAAYALNPKYQEELSKLLNANLVFVEYRYFLESTPEPKNWDYLTALLPTLSSAQDDRERVKNMTRRAIKTSTYIMAPLMVGLAFCATPIVRLVLTEKWLPCVPYLQIFCITYMFWPIHTANLNAINAMGRSDYFLKLEIAKKTIGMILLLSTMRFGVMVMAYSLLISSITSQIINSWPNKRLLGYGYLEQLRDIFPSIMTALFMGGCVNLVKLFGLSDLLTLLIQVPLGAIIYIGLSSLLHLEAYQYLTSIVQSVVSKK